MYRNNLHESATPHAARLDDVCRFRGVSRGKTAPLTHGENTLWLLYTELVSCKSGLVSREIYAGAAVTRSRRKPVATVYGPPIVARVLIHWTTVSLS